MAAVLQAWGSSAEPGTSESQVGIHWAFKLVLRVQLSTYLDVQDQTAAEIGLGFSKSFSCFCPRM